MAKSRSGLPTLLLIGKTLCLFMQRWAGKIRVSHGENADLMAVLDAIDAICDTLEPAVREALPQGD